MVCVVVDIDDRRLCHEVYHISLGLRCKLDIPNMYLPNIESLRSKI